MKKGVDTLFLAARQLVLWPSVVAGDLDRAVGAALPLPRYVVRRASSVEQTLDFVARSKIEVALVEVGDPSMLATLERLHGADPDLEVLVMADRGRLEAIAPKGFPEWADVVGTPFGAGELVRRVELARERRYLRRGEQRRKRVEARMSAIVRAVPSGIMSLDHDGVVHDWNPAAGQIFGSSDVEALGRSFWDLVGLPAATWKDPQGAWCYGEKREGLARHRSGRSFPIEMSLVPVPLSEKTMMCAIVEDRSAPRRLEIELRQAQKLEAVGQLAAGLAHEINTPLQYMGNNLSMLSNIFDDLRPVLAAHRALAEAATRGSVSDELLAEVASAEEDADLDEGLGLVPRSLLTITEGMKRIADIVSSMKSFARVSWSDGSQVDVNEALRTVLAVTEHPLKAVAELELDLQPVPMVVGQGGELNQAFYNLIRNAIDAVEARLTAGGTGAAGTRGRIAVSSRAEGGMVAVTITDSGSGIPEAIRTRIFEPFFTTKQVGGGIGQGLSVTWSILVEHHGGKLTFESTEGVGTRFLVQLPGAGPA